MAKVRADEIKLALYHRHVDKQRPDAFFTEVKNGRTHYARPGELRIIDALAIRKSWAQPCITAYEVKVSRSDFTSDDKWLDYLPLCHEFLFACPAGLIQPDEVAEDAGLVWYYPERRTLRTVKKPVFRQIELPTDMLYYIIMSKVEPVRHPFFSTQRELLQAWVQDKVARRELAHLVQSKLLQAMVDQERELIALRRELSREQRAREFAQADLDGIKKVLADAGVDTRQWRWVEELRTRMTVGVSADAVALVGSIQSFADQLAQLLRPDEPEADKEAV